MIGRSQSVLFKTKQGLYAPSTLCKAEDKEAKVKWVWECLGPTVSLFTFNKNTKNVTKKDCHTLDDVKRLRLRLPNFFDCYTLFAFDEPSVMILIFSPLRHYDI